MFDAIHGLPVFIVAGLLLNLTPGPDMLFILGHAASHGRRGVLVCVAIALLAGVARERLLKDGAARGASWLKRLAGALFIGLGLRLAISER